jgi:RNA polymerase sigma-70 factor (ECF subfamily)
MYDAAAPNPAPEPNREPSASLTCASDQSAKGCDGAFEDPSDDGQLHVEERALVEAARQNRAAFAPLYRRYVAPVYRYFYQQVTTREDAEDLTASTFSKALAGLDRYEGRGSFAAWLFGIARHTLIDHQRARYTAGVAPAAHATESVRGVGSEGDHAGVRDPASSLADPAPGPETQVLLSEQAAYLRGLVATLPDEQREAVVLRIFGGLRTRDVAKVLGKSDAAVKMLVHRAVATLRARYGAYGQEAGS